MKVFLLTAYVAAKGSHFFNGEPGIFDNEECTLAAPKGVAMGTVYELVMDGSPVTCIVRDRIGTPLAPNHLDLLMQTREEAIEFGRQSMTGRRIYKENT